MSGPTQQIILDQTSFRFQLALLVQVVSVQIHIGGVVVDKMIPEGLTPKQVNLGEAEDMTANQSI